MDSKSTILAITVTWLGACGGSTTPTDVADTGADLGTTDTSDAPSSSEITCDGSKLLAVPTDTSQRGPWPVGAKTVTLAGLVTEVWYPAVVGSDAGKTKLQYDIRKHLPPADAAKIPDADNPLQACDCYADLPMDTAHGPYPLVLFIHGTAAFRTQSASQATHWASRGFVVVAADHPGIGLQDILAGQRRRRRAVGARRAREGVDPAGRARRDRGLDAGVDPHPRWTGRRRRALQRPAGRLRQLAEEEAPGRPRERGAPRVQRSLRDPEGWQGHPADRGGQRHHREPAHLDAVAGRLQAGPARAGEGLEGDRRGHVGGARGDALVLHDGGGAADGAEGHLRGRGRVQRGALISRRRSRPSRPHR
ncbi:MAG: hypothetical protein JNL79_20685 [Myxococcales bacterium]|nr:hypothetical protein [Myxococcales bacterium]